MEKQTLGEIAAQKLLGMIQDKGYTAGDKLPTEAELVERLGVGRNTVREALRILMSVSYTHLDWGNHLPGSGSGGGCGRKGSDARIH